MNQQKRAIIIGATSGIGKAITLTLLKKGWKVGIAGRRKALLRQTYRKRHRMLLFIKYWM